MSSSTSENDFAKLAELQLALRNNGPVQASLPVPQMVPVRPTTWIKPDTNDESSLMNP
jgi:hypothetical protein